MKIDMKAYREKHPTLAAQLDLKTTQAREQPRKAQEDAPVPQQPAAAEQAITDDTGWRRRG